MHRVLMALWILAGTAVAAGGGEEWKDAHRARVPARAQIELADDELGSAGYGRGRGEERREHGVSGAVTPPPATARRAPGGLSAGRTFRPADLSAEHGIGRLTRTVSAERLGRRLFGAPEKTAAYYRVRYLQRAPFVEALYVQFVTDPVWGRVVYGNVDRWIRSLPVNGPSGVAADAAGRVFIGERGRARVLVARLAGAADEAVLREEGAITGMTEPTDLVHDDAGTPLDPGDDRLVVADAAAGVVHVFTLGGGASAREAGYGGFSSPTAVAVGRTNGVCNNRLYVVDDAGRRLRAFSRTAGELHVIAEVRGGPGEYFRSLKVDHFGGVYVAEQSGSRLVKYSALLEYLDEEGGGDAFQGLAAVDIPFGTVTIEGEGTFWTGFDQLFALEQWGAGSGAQRRTLGPALRNVVFDADNETGAVGAAFLLTDAGNLELRIRDAAGRTVSTPAGRWMAPGSRSTAWDRRDDAGRLVPPGMYRCELGVRGAYGGEAVTVAVRMTLPLYYDEECGHPDPARRPHRVTGRSVVPGDGSSGTADEDAEAVEYRFAGVAANRPVQVRVELPADPSGGRSQRIVANGVLLADGLRSGDAPLLTSWLEVPAGRVASGVLVLRVEGENSGGASVSRIRVRQDGGGVSIEPVEETVPARFSLEQNYPNPFNPSTVIRFAVPEAGPVTLTLYTLTGAVAARLVDDRREAGVHEVVVDGRTLAGGLASGVYLYRLVQGERAEVRKMVLVK
jgi:hypothetical protein